VKVRGPLPLLTSFIPLALACSAAEPTDPTSAVDAAGWSPHDAGGEGGEECAAEPCSIEEQCGCPAGDACDLDSTQLATGAAKCRPADPTGTGACEIFADCAIGRTCAGRPGLCREFCSEDADCDGTARCILALTYTDDTGDSEPVPGVTLCTTDCKADQENSCPPGRACRIALRGSESGNYWYTDCRPSQGPGGGGSPCPGGDGDCLPGYDCVITGGDKVCAEVCVLNVAAEPGPRTCNAGGTCVGFNPDALVGEVEYGVCIL
jgi:hypothetical protein